MASTLDRGTAGAIGRGHTGALPPTHLPWSPRVAEGRRREPYPSAPAGREVVAAAKLDGKNTTTYAHGVHACSLDPADHPSRAWVTSLRGRIAAHIPVRRRVCGENVYARHSILYEDLDSCIYAFSVRDGARCLDWDATVRFARRLGILVPPILKRGRFDERATRSAMRVRGVPGRRVRAAGRHMGAPAPRKTDTHPVPW